MENLCAVWAITYKNNVYMLKTFEINESNKQF